MDDSGEQFEVLSFVSEGSLGDELGSGGSAAFLRRFTGAPPIVTAEGPYRRAADLYWRAGWRGILPLPTGQKANPPDGFTGYVKGTNNLAPYLSYPDLAALREDSEPGGNIALRVNVDVLGIDVDAYGDKPGAETLANMERTWGPLPATWRSTARDPRSPSGIRFFRVPAGIRWRGGLPGIEIIQPGHRYAVVWPSVHPDGMTYEWYEGTSLDPAGLVPEVDWLASLPDEWQSGLRVNAARVAGVDIADSAVKTWLAACRPDPMCARVRNMLLRAAREIKAPRNRSRHDIALDATRTIVAYGGEGHAGARKACQQLMDVFVGEVCTPGGGKLVRDEREARTEYLKMVTGAVRVAAAKHREPAEWCDCIAPDDEWTGARPANGSERFEAKTLAAPGAPTRVDTVEQELRSAVNGSKLVNGAPGPATPRGQADDDASTGAVAETTATIERPAEHGPISDTVPVSDPQPAPPADPPAAPPATAGNEPWSWDGFGCTQDGMARAFLTKYGDRIRYVVDGQPGWLVWDGTKWARDVAEEHRELLKVLMRALPDDRAKWRGMCLSAAGIAGVLRMAQSDRRITVRGQELDSDPWAINTPAGIVDLKTGNVRPHDPSEAHTRITSCAPDFKADRSEWFKFLDQVFLGDQELIKYMQRLAGYTLTGSAGAHVLPFCFGSGGNGKSVFIEVLAEIMSVDDITGYAKPAANTFLMSRANGPEHRTEIASLAGARMIMASEVNKNDRVDEAKVKQLTGDKFIRARFSHKDEFSFRMAATIWLVGNVYPEVSSGGPSFWRRVRTIPFQWSCPKDQIEKDLGDRLVREHGPAILAWMIEGATEYAKSGLDPEPECVRAATEEYASDQDHLGRFAEECLNIAPGTVMMRVETKKLFERYEAWCRENRVPAAQVLNPSYLGRALRAQHRIESKPSNGRNYYVGVALVTERHDEEDEPEQWTQTTM